MDGSLRLQGGEAGPSYEYGRLEIFLRGFWSNICSVEAFTPDSARVACSALGFDGGASLNFPTAFFGDNVVRFPRCIHACINICTTASFTVVSRPNKVLPGHCVGEMDGNGYFALMDVACNIFTFTFTLTHYFLCSSGKSYSMYMDIYIHTYTYTYIYI